MDDRYVLFCFFKTGQRSGGQSFKKSQKCFYSASFSLVNLVKRDKSEVSFSKGCGQEGNAYSGQIHTTSNDSLTQICCAVHIFRRLTIKIPVVIAVHYCVVRGYIQSLWCYTDASRPGHSGKATKVRQWTEGNHPPADHCGWSFGSICDINI